MGFFLTDNLFINIFQALYLVTVVGLVIVVISENRNPLKTMSWVLVLLFFPIGGLIIYYFFGEDHRKRRLISRKMKKKLNRKAFLRYEVEETPSASSSEHKSLIQLLTKLDESPLYEGNKITFYSEGISKFAALTQELENAQSQIHIQYYIFLDDEIGTKIQEILMRKAREGVEVRVLYDDVGSWKAKSKFYKEMEQAGVFVEPFLKVRFPLLTSRVNYRNHRKVVVIDGIVGFMGGMNIADRYTKGINGGVWRDCHFKIEGRAVHGLQTSFAVDWYASRAEFLLSRKYFPALESKGDSPMQIATSGPTGRFKSIPLAIYHAIANAQESVYVQTPYFIPSDTLLLALQTASLRGVDVRVMIPLHSDTKTAQLASQAYVRDLLNAKINVYFYDNGFLHSKMLVIDDHLTIAGSANMDVRSFEHNFEIMAFIYDKKNAQETKEIFLRDQEVSKFVTSKEEWDNRPRMQKFKESVMRMFSPLL